jgi:uncharacterized protein DUF2877
MQSTNALSLSADVKDWLANSRHSRVLHVFDRACNLINERREVLSIVTPRIGNGPFNLVVEDDICFSEHLGLEAEVSIARTQLQIGDLIVYIANAKIWNPRPAWASLHVQRDKIFDQLGTISIPKCQVLGLDMPLGKHSGLLDQRDLPITHYQFSNSLVSNLSLALVNADISSALKITSRLAGLGAGLTPAGDDFIMGALYAAWIIHPPEVASILAQEVANTAAPLTTSLSAAWLKSAGRGEAGILWHQFFNALLSADPVLIHNATEKILAVGETSGADALAGFIGLFIYWGQHCSNL